jgi:hypothetical protein
MTLTLIPNIRQGTGQSLPEGEIIGYEVAGLPDHEKAYIRKAGQTWQIVRVRNGTQSAWPGEFDSAEDAKIALERSVRDPADENKRTQFLIGEFLRAVHESREPTLSDRAIQVEQAIDSGDLYRRNDAIAAFINNTSEYESYDHETAYGFALHGRGDPTFSAEHVAESVLPLDRREDFERAVREGQMDAAGAVIGIDPLLKVRAILRQLSDAING